MKRIVQIELTNHCNRKCHYCGQTNMTREKGYISWPIVEQCIIVLKKLNQTGNVGINHYGESLMHPDVIAIIELMNLSGITPWLYTNGDFLSDDMIKSLSRVRLSSVTISSHASIIVRQAMQLKCYEAGITAYWQRDFTPEGTLSIGKQIEGVGYDKDMPALIDPANHCRFLKEESAIVLWNGDLVPCCVDYDGKGIFGNIMDENAESLKPKWFSICGQCPGHPGNII